MEYAGLVVGVTFPATAGSVQRWSACAAPIYLHNALQTEELGTRTSNVSSYFDSLILHNT